MIALLRGLDSPFLTDGGLPLTVQLRKAVSDFMPSADSPHLERGTLLFTNQRTLASDTLHEESRSIEAVISTEEPAAVFDYETYEIIDEVLVSDGVRFLQHVPLLRNHSRASELDVIGSAREFRQETAEGSSGQWVSRVYFASPYNEEDEAGKIWHRVKEKHIRAVSIGYWPLRYVDVPAGESATIEGRRYTAKAGRRLRVTLEALVFELSVVPVGADRNALFRGGAPSTSHSRQSASQVLGVMR